MVDNRFAYCIFSIESQDQILYVEIQRVDNFKRKVWLLEEI